ncbi:unnamed protein product [Trichobilharzia regenti]|nr:unnamed protein product [Trichobilharzia regenti]
MTTKHQVKKQPTPVNPVQHLETSEVVQCHQHHTGHFKHTELKSSVKLSGTDQFGLNEPFSPPSSLSQGQTVGATTAPQENTAGMKQRLIESRSPNTGLGRSHTNFDNKNNNLMINVNTTTKSNNSGCQNPLSSRNLSLRTSSLFPNAFQTMTQSLKPLCSPDSTNFTSNNSSNCPIASSSSDDGVSATMSLTDQWSSVISNNLHMHNTTTAINIPYPSLSLSTQHHSQRNYLHASGVYNDSEYVSPTFNSDHSHLHPSQLQTSQSCINNNAPNMYPDNTSSGSVSNDSRYHTTSISVHLSKMVRHTYPSNTVETDEQQNLCLLRNCSNQSECGNSICSGQNSSCGSSGITNNSIHSREATG